MRGDPGRKGGFWGNSYDILQWRRLNYFRNEKIIMLRNRENDHCGVCSSHQMSHPYKDVWHSRIERARLGFIYWPGPWWRVCTVPCSASGATVIHVVRE